MSNNPRNPRRVHRATPLGEWAAATDEDLGRLIASELEGVAERPRLLSRVGLWTTFVAHEARGGERVLVNIRPRATVGDEVAERVLRAAATDRAWQHPSVLPVRRSGSSERLLWISLPELGGWPLRQWFSEERVPSPTSALEFLRHVAAPLIAMHAAGRVHGALTPSGFHRDSTGVVRVCCPGVDLELLRGDLAAGVDSEAAAFAAPEVRAGREPDAAADQYVLAAILVKLISGRTVAAGEDLPAEVPSRWAPSLRRALDRDPRSRETSVRALVARLDPDSLASAGSWTTAGSHSAGAAAAYQPSWFRRRRGSGPRLEEAPEEGPPLDDLQVLFPPPDGEEEPGPPEPAPVQGGGWGRRIFGTAILLLLGGMVGVAYAGGAPAVMPEILGATLDDWIQNWYAWAPIGERLERTPGAGAAVDTALGMPGDHTETAAPSTAETLVDSSGLAAPSPEEAPAEVPPDAEPPAVPEAVATAPDRDTARPEAASVAPPSTGSPRSGSLPPPPSPEPAAERPAYGRLSLQSYPWGAVYIDGVFVGNTPLLDVRVSAGDHQIRIERPPYDPFSVIVTVEPGQTLRLTGIVLTGGGR